MPTKIKVAGKDFSIHHILQKKLDNVKMIMRKKWDAVILIDGKEGSGKSTLSFICGWYLTDGKLTLNNVCEGTEDAVRKLEKLPDGSVLIIDEGSLMFSSKDTMRKEQRQLIKILNVIRQKRMCLIIVAPSFFDLNKYISVDRSRFLLHVYTTKNLDRGRFCYFSEKKKTKLYQLGKKNYNSYSKPKSNWRGDFVAFDPFGEEYQELKRKSLMESFHDKKPLDPKQILFEVRKDTASRLWNKLPVTNKKELAKALGITRQMLYNYKKGDPSFGQVTSVPQLMLKLTG